HETGDGLPFFSLYGHLSPETLTHLRAGTPVQAGELLGWVGSPPSNGDWAPHVHVQLLLDLLDLGADHPGVAAPSQEDTWLGLSPDPALLLRLPDHSTPESPRSVADTLAER